MNKYINFEKFWGDYWPAADELKPYFLAPVGKEWFYTGGNDSGGLSLEGLDGTEHLPLGQGRNDIWLSMWGNPDLGVLLQYTIITGDKPRQDWFSKGDMTKLRQWVRTLHADPMPVGLYIPFPKAWLAVKEFMETEGQLPTSIEWVTSDELPDNTFPTPTVRLPGEPDNGWPPIEA